MIICPFTLMPVNHDESHLVISLLCLQLSTVGRADACLSPQGVRVIIS